jgi:hypothetical protein
MDSNTHSGSRLDRLGALTASVDELVAEDLDGLGDAARAERVLTLRELVDRLEGQWLAELAAVDARGAAGAEHGVQAGSTPPGCGPGSTWAPGPLPAGCGPPGRCTEDR